MKTKIIMVVLFKAESGAFRKNPVRARLVLSKLEMTDYDFEKSGCVRCVVEDFSEDALGVLGWRQTFPFSAESVLERAMVKIGIGDFQRAQEGDLPALDVGLLKFPIA